MRGLDYKIVIVKRKINNDGYQILSWKSTDLVNS